MNSDRLLEVYEQISEAPDAIARLRRFVLALAVRGKLVGQDAGDEPASQLLKRMSAERSELERAKVIKKVKLKEFSGSPDQIPANWKWTQLGDVGDWGSGSTPPRGNSDFYGEGISWLKSGELGDNLNLAGSEETVTERAISKCSFRLNKPGDVLIAMYGATIGKLAILAEEAVTNQAVCGCTPFTGLLNRYLFLFLLANREAFHASSEGGAQPNISKVKVINTAFPLPPLAEQHRIVAKVDELMALCDRLEEARKTREVTRDKLTAASLARLTAPDTTPEDFPTHAAFALEALPALTARPDQIKTFRQTILNLAVRGNLVKQDPADEPASASLANIAEARDADASRKSKRARGLPRVSDAEASELPTGWESVRLSDIAISMRYGTSTKCGADASLVPVLRIPNVSSGHVTLDDMKFGPLNEREHEDLALASGDLLMIRSNGSLDIVGRSAVVPTEANGMAFAGYLVRLRTAIEHVNTTYVWMAMNSQLIRDQIEKPIRSAVGLKNVNLTEFGNLSFWLPPLAEQHRIVAKVEALMTLCDRLETALTTADTTRTRLLEALLHDALEPATDTLKAAE